MGGQLFFEAKTAFLTALASFRAVNGSYEVTAIRHLAYKNRLSENEWQMCIKLYNSKLLPEKERNEKQRAQHLQIAQHLQEKVEIAKKVAQSIPEIVDIFLVNSFTFGALKPTSDIDLLVVVQPGTIYWTRLKLTAALEKLGIRRKPGHIEEQICLSFFITTEHLNMASIAYKNDIHFAYWSMLAQSLLGTLEYTWWQENEWLHSLFPNYHYKTHYQNPVSTAPKQLSKLANQLVKIPMKLRHHLNKKKLGPESSIIISDNILKFHNIDRRKFYREKTLQELQILEKMCQ